MWDRLWDFFVGALMTLFMPVVCSYFTISAHPFLNMAIQEATGLEWAGNQLLGPVQYILAGKKAIQKGDGSWEYVQRYDYSNGFWVKSAASVLAGAPSLFFGTAIKGLGFLSKETRMRHASLSASLKSSRIDSNLPYYRTLGIAVEGEGDRFLSEGYLRRPGDEKVLQLEKKGLREITKILNEAQIPWWVDCGTCLGAYRYGGVIPWDGDIDMAALLPDFQNVRKALNRLDPLEYIVQDWSSRDHPDSYLKVYIRKSATMIDIYFFDIVPEANEFRYILSLETHMFFPEWWKIRERRFKAPVPFETLFPLRKANLDGIEVFVPNETKKYLQRCYGDNLAPAKVYDSATCRYERDLSHPYWQRAYVH